jgi:hypothetical protein
VNAVREVYAFALTDRQAQRLARMVLVGVVIVLAVGLPPVPATVFASLVFLRLQVALRRRPLVERA